MKLVQLCECQGRSQDCCGEVKAGEGSESSINILYLLMILLIDFTLYFAKSKVNASFSNQSEFDFKIV